MVFLSFTSALTSTREEDHPGVTSTWEEGDHPGVTSTWEEEDHAAVVNMEQTLPRRPCQVALLK